jgi:hypothetical protein
LHSTWPITLVAGGASGLTFSPSVVPGDGQEQIVTVTGGGAWTGILEFVVIALGPPHPSVPSTN